ncbi:MAG: hypothetical protein PHE56_04525, partial [Bacteroidales bacterium]|nr:hypothetical protein [Bacteroidales bacterium]
DYALTGRPVLDISSNFNEVSDFMCFFNGDYSNFTTSIDVNKYDIKNIAQSYLMLVDRKS